MPDFLGSLREFLSAVVHWWYVVVICIAIGIYSLIQIVVTSHFSVDLLTILVLAGLLIASFLAFRDQRKRRLAAERLTGISALPSAETLTRDTLSLAQDMVEFLSDAQRDRPGYATESTPLSGTQEEMFAAWQRSTKALREHEDRVLGRFQEKFLVRTAGAVQRLKACGIMTEDEERRLWWALQSLYSVGQIPQILASKAHVLQQHPNGQLARTADEDEHQVAFDPRSRTDLNEPLGLAADQRAAVKPRSLSP
jgi:hypothetical protein